MYIDVATINKCNCLSANVATVISYSYFKVVAAHPLSRWRH